MTRRHGRRVEMLTIELLVDRCRKAEKYILLLQSTPWIIPNTVTWYRYKYIRISMCRVCLPVIDTAGFLTKASFGKTRIDIIFQNKLRRPI